MPSIYQRLCNRVDYHWQRFIPRVDIVLAHIARLVTPSLWLHTVTPRKLAYPAGDIRLSITTPSELRLRAKVGAYSLSAAKRHPEIHIVAVEPSHSTFSQLCNNLLLNALAHSVKPIQAALTAKTRVGTLHL